MTERDSALRIAVFNHKGGVGKTTLTVNIAAALAGDGYTVLLVDSDPQCNLTSYLIEDSVVNDLLEKSDSEKGRTVWSAVKPIVEAEGRARQVQPIELARANLLLVPGDIRLSEFEPELTSRWRDCLERQIKGFSGTGGLSLLINELAAEHGCHFVFYDCGPNIGPLNRAILLDCDYFIVPAACDVFSARALFTLGHSLKRWITSWDVILKFAPDGLYLLPGMPKLLGYIPQRFRMYRGQPAQAYSDYLPTIEARLAADVIRPLRSISSVLAPYVGSRVKLGEVKEFGSLVPQSQHEGVPLWEVHAGSAAQRAAALRTFNKIAQRIVQRVDAKWNT